MGLSVTAIFISHSHHDRHIARELRKWLSYQGYEAVLYNPDQDLTAENDNDWKETLSDKLTPCRAAIVLLSPQWRDSPFCQDQLDLVQEACEEIFPVNVANWNHEEILPDYPHTDLASDHGDGLARLNRVLVHHGLHVDLPNRARNR